MKSRLLLAAAVIAGLLARPLLPVDHPLHAQSRPDEVALTGLVSAADEGPLEGVLVSARKTGSTITTTVVTDQTGRYRFPRARLEPGQYTMRIKATGFDLDAPVTSSIAAAKTTTADLKLLKARDVAAQLSNAEWLASFPGTDEQKSSIRGCTHCHTLERIARTKYTADQLMGVIERMSTYPQLSFPMKIQKLVAPRIGGGTVSPEQQRAAWRRQAEYLATINLSTAPQWSYPFKILPRPTGAATQVIYTEYDLPQRTRQPHDVIVDSTGTAWYASFGEQILGKLDPRTGQVVEWEIPTLKDTAPTGVLGVRFDRDENLWLGMQFQGGVAKFDRKTETFESWSLPPALNGPHVQINQVSPGRAYVDNRIWLQDAGTYTVLRLDPSAGKFEVFEPYAIPRPNVYDVIPDSKNNGYFLVLGAEDIGRIDAKSGDITIFKTPTPRSGPRRGMMDAQDRLWFGENNGDRIGMFDTRTQRFQEWPVPTPGAYPYDVTADRNGIVWTGGEYNDRILRLDPSTGRFTEYALPRATNVRRVFVDNRTTPVSFWVGNNHGASIVRLEPLDAQVASSVAGASTLGPDGTAGTAKTAGITLEKVRPATSAVSAVPSGRRTPEASSDETIYEGARLIAGDGRPPLDNAAFIVSGDRIVRVGTKGSLDVAGARHVDLTGKTVMPTLIDAHVHLGYRQGTTFAAANYTRENLTAILDRLSYYGVAAVLEAGTGRGDLPFQVRDEHRPGTRYLTAGRGFAMPNAGPGGPMRDAAYGVTTEADARDKVRELAAHKPDLIKIWVDDRNGTVEKLKPNLYRAIIDEAHAHRIRVMAHIAALDDAKDLLRAGVDGFGHCVRDRDVDAELIAMLKERPNVFFLVTMWGERNAIYDGPPEWLDEPIVRDTLSAEEIQQLRDGFLPAAAPATLQRAAEDADRLLRNVATLFKAGVRIGLGTDTGGVTGGGAFGLASHVEMELMVKAGLTPAQAIVAATRTSAEILGLDTLGTIAAGKSADFLVLDANPLEAIGNTRRISTVYMQGVEVGPRRLRKAPTAVNH